MSGVDGPTLLGIATATAFPDLTDDDAPAAAELRRRGFEVDPVIWDDPGIDWAGYDAVILRSCWGYHECPEPFLRWLATLESTGVDVWNRPDTVRWNINKTYLTELDAIGIPIVPTVIIEQSSPNQLATVKEEHGWSQVVVKPGIAATAYRTTRVTASEVRAGQCHLDRILNNSDAIVQPFLPFIKEKGEWSLMFIGGEFSHSVKKYPPPDDYRVQSEFGGTTRREKASDPVIDQTKQVVDYLDTPPLYARVDGVMIDDGFKLMELELIEPEMFFRYSATAASNFADQVEKRM